MNRILAFFLLVALVPLASADDDDFDDVVIIGGDDDEGGFSDNAGGGGGVDLEDIAVVQDAASCFAAPIKGLNANANIHAGNAGFVTRFTYVRDRNMCKPLFVQESKKNSSPNSFRNLRDCERTCRDVVEPGCFNPASPLQCGRDFHRFCAALPVVDRRSGRTKCQKCCCPPKGFRPAMCALPPYEGVGRAVIPSWYFDAASKSCKKFDWSGQANRNNLNRFPCRESCEKACRGRRRY